MLSLFLALSSNVAPLSRAQQPTLTNVFPTNLFLTDENRLFSYKNGERVVDTRRVQQAEKCSESRPAEQDPEGHWGKVVDGFQLSLRFEKQEFTNGEPVWATILLRNVSDRQLTYIAEEVAGRPSPIHVSVWTQQGKLNLKTNHAVIPIVSVRSASLYPRTQHRYRLRLDRYYDLSKVGAYSAQAEYGPGAPSGPFPVRAAGREEITSQRTCISIGSASPH